MTAMLQVVFMAIGLAVLTFVLAFLFRKWQRAILWAVALLLFVGTSILLGVGVLKIYENGMIDHAVLLGITLAYACSFIFIYAKATADIIQNVNTDSKARIATIYNVSGTRMSQMQKGVNIVKRSDGTVSKVLVK
jgi:purine-cytosine permease-like protein